MQNITYEKVTINPNANAMIHLLNQETVNVNPSPVKQTYIPPHWHRSIEFSLVIHGNVNLTVNNQTKVIHPGEFIFVNSAQVHQLTTADGQLDDYEVLLVIISYDFIKQVIPDIDERCFDITHKCNSLQRLHEIYDFFYCHCIHPNEHDDILIQAYLHEILYILLRDYQADAQTRSRFLAQQHRHHILEYIEQHYAEELTLHEMAKLSFMSEEHFSRSFKKIFGINFKNYLTDYRLYQAYADIVNTEKSIQDIALTHGFSSVKIFIACFKSKYGTTPLQYRKGIQKGK